MTSVIVSGSDVPSILAAQAAAGVGGSLLFPNGSPCVVDGLTATVANQTWTFEPGATLLRSPTSSASLLTLLAPGLKIRGGTFDNNSANNANVGNFIDLGTDPSGNTAGFDLDIEGATFQNGLKWGVFGYTATLRVARCHFTNIRWGEIRWGHTLLIGAVGPEITDNVIDKSMIQNIDSGSIYAACANSGKYQLALMPKIYRNNITQPSMQNSNIVGILVEGCQRGFVCDNKIFGGGNGISLDNNQYTEIRGNNFQCCGTYAIELGGNDNLVTGNKGTGLGPSMFGIFVNPVVTGSAVIANHFVNGFTNGGIVNQAGAGCYLADNW